MDVDFPQELGIGHPGDGVTSELLVPFQTQRTLQSIHQSRYTTTQQKNVMPRIHSETMPCDAIYPLNGSNEKPVELAPSTPTL